MGRVGERRGGRRGSGSVCQSSAWNGLGQGVVLRLVARVQRTKLSEGLLQAGWGAMSHVSALKKETGAEWRVAGAKVTRSQRRDLQS